MSGRASQRKGADGERELAAIFKKHGYDCTRGGSLSFGEVPDLGEGQLSTIVSIRDKRRRGKKLEKWEQDFYKNNKKAIDMNPQRSNKDDEILKAWGIGC